jgi:flavin-dependent dehydrogenase
VEAKNGRFVREQFQLFMKRHASHVKPFSYWAAILPTPKDPKFFSLPTSGSDWLLAGDAAGHVDTLTGAGIPYALWGAELAADAIASGDVRSYERLWRKEYSSLLLESIKMRRLFSNSFFLETFIGLSSKSETLGNILCGLFDNEQDYLTVGKDFARKLPRILAELV